MITVAGFNTAIDKWIEIDRFSTGVVNRAHQVLAFPGGKGAHVALTAAALGAPVNLIGIVDEPHRLIFHEYFASKGIAFYGVTVRESIRTCLAIRDADGTITEILEPGPTVDREAGPKLIQTFKQQSEGASIAVFSGSLPPCLPSSTYAELIRAFRGSSTKCLLDTSGKALQEGIDASPFMVKPNRDEAENLTGRTIGSFADALAVARSIQERGSPLVVVSLGAQGAVAVWQNRSYRIRVPLVPDRNPVGSGDCLVGGIAAALSNGKEIEEALRLGVACGAANAFSAETGTFALGDLERILAQVQLDCESND